MWFKQLLSLSAIALLATTVDAKMESYTMKVYAPKNPALHGLFLHASNSEFRTGEDGPAVIPCPPEITEEDCPVGNQTLVNGRIKSLKVRFRLLPGIMGTDDLPTDPLAQGQTAAICQRDRRHVVQKARDPWPTARCIPDHRVLENQARVHHREQRGRLQVELGSEPTAGRHVSLSHSVHHPVQGQSEDGHHRAHVPKGGRHHDHWLAGRFRRLGVHVGSELSCRIIFHNQYQ